MNGELVHIGKSIVIKGELSGSEDLTVEGDDYLPRQGPLIVAARHYHHLYDGVALMATVPRPMHISGWDMASDKAKGGAPRATSRLVPPGAVYFLARADGRPFTPADAEALWLAAPLGGRTNEGFGCVVPGIWNPEDIE